MFTKLKNNLKTEEILILIILVISLTNILDNYLFKKIDKSEDKIKILLKIMLEVFLITLCLIFTSKNIIKNDINPVLISIIITLSVILFSNKTFDKINFLIQVNLENYIDFNIFRMHHGKTFKNNKYKDIMNGEKYNSLNRTNKEIKSGKYVYADTTISNLRKKLLNMVKTIGIDSFKEARLTT